MAAAEARTLWQRAVNRCFVQEDAKRAPKLACCQSSSSASTKQFDSSGSTGTAPDLHDQSSACFMPLNRNPRFPDLPPDTRWWAHIQPGYPDRKDLVKDQMRPLEANADIPGEGSATVIRSPSKDDCSFGPEDDQGRPRCKKRNPGTGENEVEALTCENFQEYIELIGYEPSKKSNELSFDMGSPWNLSSEKAEPWWRTTTDKDELASLVAQKSLDYVENCDLPTPQKIHKKRPSYDSPRCFNSDGLSSLDCDSRAGHVRDPTMHGHGQQWAATRDGHEQSSSEKSFSLKDRTEKQSQASSDGSGLSKEELLEAIRHSQTRAREAEKAAQEAKKEKEHLMELLFRQASQIFAYKQWFQLLQLEELCLQAKKKKDPLPWKHWEGRKQRKKWNKEHGGKRAAKQNHHVLFALGLSLVGAGLLLGWTIGWMIPF
ncbi:PREDICTED: uncharacterized protein LOC104802082 [Tarenaya hassleriana]|uniref:uncharacterized protein LOC104802082 n=1 Tax=Tarenaya hassleriana TaxID=28532 RepID=UPI00053C4980|nr:PREDICTED: uncharacterized protein LOC104802082 [Tarenaya hassleriana]XP_010523819.1 PREDICTED: uncharacterized protein LOC104802082 [Tarenaya hassleriana]